MPVFCDRRVGEADPLPQTPRPPPPPASARRHRSRQKEFPKKNNSGEVQSSARIRRAARFRLARVERTKRRNAPKRLMTIPGIGPIVGLTYMATIDDASRFQTSKAVAAHLGLTPRVYQSGEIDRSGNISKCGGRLLRHALYEAANSHMRISKKWSSHKAWGVKLAKRVGMKKALEAVPRKLAIIMHRMWLNGTEFQFSNVQGTPAVELGVSS